MAIHTTVTRPGIYFLTFTCYQWFPLIQLVNGYEMVYKWFDILSGNGHAITGYVIMPNHLHMLLYFRESKASLNTVIGNGKRFMAYDIINALTHQSEKGILAKLEHGVRPTDKRRGKKHAVWQDSFDVKECRTEKFLLQKLNYIHNKPCSGKWNLAESPIHYPHSSALFYLTGKQGGYAVKDYLEFLEFEEQE
jgi:REP element-mobilizing transposase RayT